MTNRVKILDFENDRFKIESYDPKSPNKGAQGAVAQSYCWSLGRQISLKKEHGGKISLNRGSLISHLNAQIKLHNKDKYVLDQIPELDKGRLWGLWGGSSNRTIKLTALFALKQGDALLAEGKRLLAKKEMPYSKDALLSLDYAARLGINEAIPLFLKENQKACDLLPNNLLNSKYYGGPRNRQAHWKSVYLDTLKENMDKLEEKYLESEADFTAFLEAISKYEFACLVVAKLLDEDFSRAASTVVRISERFNKKSDALFDVVKAKYNKVVEALHKCRKEDPVTYDPQLFEMPEDCFSWDIET